MKTLEELGNEWSNSHNEIVEATKSRIVRWEFKTSQFYWPGPLGFELKQLPRGRPVSVKSKAKSHYGYDADGRLVYVGVQAGICDWDEHCIFYGKDVAETAVFRSNHWDGKIATELQRVCRTHFSGGREQSIETMGFSKAFGAQPAPGKRPTMVLTYHWSDDQITRIHSGCKLDGRMQTDDHLNITYTAAYDASGDLISLIKTWQSGAVEKLVHKKPAGVTVNSLSTAVRDQLQKAVLAAATKAQIKKPVYAVVLAYDGEDDSILPPVLGFGLEEERCRWRDGDSTRLKIWNPAEWTHYEKKHTQLADQKLDELVELLNSQWKEKGATTPAKKLLLDICRDLAGRQWPFPTTPDFVVYCVDFELSELRKNFKALVPSARLAEFKKAKLL